MKSFNIGTLNVRGSREVFKIDTIAKDAIAYNIQVLGVTETHIKEEESRVVSVESNNVKRSFNFYSGGIEEDNVYQGVGILVEENLKSHFHRITDRICTCEIDIEEEQRKIIIIVAYAPTLVKSESSPEVAEEFYEALESTIKKVKSRHPLFLIGDFNAKTGSGFRDYPENMGRYGKGKLNSNGKHLLELAKLNKLVLTNTTFYHKMAHRTTWTAPEQISDRKHFDGTVRKNPYRNQIDYILTKIDDKMFVTNSRSYGGFETYTDHKLVIANIKLEWWRKKAKVIKREKINFSESNDDKNRAYQEKIKETLRTDRADDDRNPNMLWNRIINVCTSSAKEIYGVVKGNKRKSEDGEIKTLSAKQKEIKLCIESTKDKKTRKELRKERNNIMNEIKLKVKMVENNKYEAELEEIEKKQDEQRCYAAVRLLKSKKTKKPLHITNDKNQTLTAESEQVTEITKYFKSVFEDEKAGDPLHYPPCPLERRFTADEIWKNVQKLKNNKSAGPDNVVGETLKYAPLEVMEEIANILNLSAETENHAEILRQGILAPLQKPPNKKKKPVENLRPITLLSVLRKVLATCLIDRIWNKIEPSIPIEQAAYQKGRSTTEQAFAMKTMAEKAITSENYNIFFLLLDMSKAFDTVNRNKLLKYLEEFLTKSEMRLVYLLISGVELRVRVGNEIGEIIETNVGVAQGDCFSAIFFIFYLAKIVKPFPEKTTEEDFEGETLWSALDWLVREDAHKIEINPKYSDDMSFVRSMESKINLIKRVIPGMLKEGDLIENSDKREEYQISRLSNTKWKSCNILGSLIDTEKDIARRKGLSLDAMKTLEPMFRSRKLSDSTKVRIFESYVSSIFLYNSELWTLTNTLDKRIDSFQRRLLRKVIRIFWPKVIRNDSLYEKTKVTPWSKKIRRRRLTWLGHLLRLDERTPARTALNEALKKVQKPVGRQKLTWIKLICDDVKINSDIELNVESEVSMIKDLIDICADRRKWRATVKHMMLQCAT